MQQLKLDLEFTIINRIPKKEEVLNSTGMFLVDKISADRVEQ